ncbi:hydroperoxide and superoxide-radical responsive glutathione-dependent oxidoreductase [Pyronema omphalodes]|nr:hydroperoxide and superoxide-radical responsive glutathione-dependent oxidoreductase [Pyronema omphalodes]KAI5815348.1 hydroperoxide and superoxide-radical responsive glutathione-dependent oxidoreductase [Pyronema omphalodes]
MATVQNITSVDQFNDLISNAPETSLVVLNFHAPWAAPCAQMNQVFSTLASQSPASTLFLAIDAEEHPDISETYEVSAVPYFVLLRNNTTLDSISGADPAKLTAAVTKHSNGGTFSLPPPQSTAPTPGNDNQQQEEEEDINTRLAKLVAAAPVMLFMKGTPAAPQCGFSKKLVALLREKEVRYGFFNILADDEVRQGLKVYSDWPTYPQLYVKGELVGGLDIVREEMENDPSFCRI